MRRTPKSNVSKFRRTIDTHLIRDDVSYEIDEICKELSVSRGRIQQWQKDGLQPIDERIPKLFYGAELKAFVRARQENRRRKCAPNEFYCFKCKEPRRSRNDVVQVQFHPNGRQVALVGRCVECDTKLFRRDVIKNLGELRKRFVF